MISPTLAWAGFVLASLAAGGNAAALSPRQLLASSSSSSTPAIYQVTPAQWAALNSSVGGRLFAGRPIDLPCYLNYNGTLNTPNAAVCNQTQSMKQDSNFIANNFGGYEYVRLAPLLPEPLQELTSYSPTGAAVKQTAKAVT